MGFFRDINGRLLRRGYEVKLVELGPLFGEAELSKCDGRVQVGSIGKITDIYEQGLVGVTFTNYAVEQTIPAKQLQWL